MSSETSVILLLPSPVFTVSLYTFCVVRMHFDFKVHVPHNRVKTPQCFLLFLQLIRFLFLI